MSSHETTFNEKTNYGERGRKIRERRVSEFAGGISAEREGEEGFRLEPGAAVFFFRKRGLMDHPFNSQ